MSYQDDQDATPRPNPKFKFQESTETHLFATQGNFSIALDSRAQVAFQTSPSPSPLKRRKSPLKRPASLFSDCSSPKKASRAGSVSSASSASSSASVAVSDSVSIVSSDSIVSSGSKRVRFGDSVRNALTGYYGTRCWLCEQRHRKTDMCHVVPKADPKFESYKAQKIIEFKKLDATENAIPLCKTCHEAMDRPPSQFIILPTDLRWFIDYEIRDYERRCTDARNGIKTDRITPTATMYRDHLRQQGKLAEFPIGAGSNRFVEKRKGGLYDVYIRVDFLSVGDVREEDEIRGLYRSSKYWHGSPCAMLLHAMKILGDLELDSNEWLKDEKEDQLMELKRLWKRPGPKVEKRTENPTNKDSGEGNTGGDDDHSSLFRGSNRSRDYNDNERRSNLAESFAGGTLIGSGGQDSCSMKNGEQKECERAGDLQILAPILSFSKKVKKWQWGPHSTSNQAAESFRRLNGFQI